MLVVEPHGFIQVFLGVGVLTAGIPDRAEIVIHLRRFLPGLQCLLKVRHRGGGVFHPQRHFCLGKEILL